MKNLKSFGRILFFTSTAFAIFIAIQAFTSTSNAATCKARLDEIGATVIGRGPTQEAAFEDAAIQCFDKKAARLKRTSQNPLSRQLSSSLDEESGMAIIDQCANLRCEG